jgi:hypothetical protein
MAKKVQKTITSKIIGQLTQDETFDDWWNSQETEIPFFDHKKLVIVFSEFEPEKDKTFLEEADSALENFLKLASDVRKSISEMAYKNCMAFLAEISFDEYDEPLRQIIDHHDIWNFIYPTKIYITRRPYMQPDMYVQVACECYWEQEHGLQLVFKLGKKLTRISEQDGHLTEADAYGKTDQEDELLSKF